jgi:outer membrane lipoprotein-sorting protein
MRRFAAFVLLAAASLAFAHAAYAYTADELAAKNVAAKGGAEQLAALHSLRLSGKLLVNGDQLQLGLVTLIERPGSIRQEAELQGLKLVQAYDGTQGWKINPFQGRKDPEKMSTDDAKELGEDAADFTGALVDYKAKGYTLDYLGTEDVDGTDAYKLRVTRPNGDITYVYLDPEFFLEIRIINRRIEHGIPVETVTDYGDYEKVAGVYFAFEQVSGPKGSQDRQKVEYDKADANAALDDSLFRLPATQPAAAANK